MASVKAPSPTRLAVLDHIPTQLALLSDTTTRLSADATATALLWLSDEGEGMATPLTITQGETGALSLACIGADGTRQDLNGATCTLRLVNLNGTVYANAVSLTITDADQGVVSWTRLAAQVADPGDYRYQVKAVLADTNTVYFPDSDPNIGNALTILRAL